MSCSGMPLTCRRASIGTTTSLKTAGGALTHSSDRSGGGWLEPIGTG